MNLILSDLDFNDHYHDFSDADLSDLDLSDFDLDLCDFDLSDFDPSDFDLSVLDCRDIIIRIKVWRTRNKKKHRRMGTMREKYRQYVRIILYVKKLHNKFQPNRTVSNGSNNFEVIDLSDLDFIDLSDLDSTDLIYLDS